MVSSPGVCLTSDKFFSFRCSLVLFEETTNTYFFSAMLLTFFVILCKKRARLLYISDEYFVSLRIVGELSGVQLSRYETFAVYFVN